MRSEESVRGSACATPLITLSTSLLLDLQGQPRWDSDAHVCAPKTLERGSRVLHQRMSDQVLTACFQGLQCCGVGYRWKARGAESQNWWWWAGALVIWVTHFAVKSQELIFNYWLISFLIIRKVILTTWTSANRCFLQKQTDHRILLLIWVPVLSF